METKHALIIGVCIIIGFAIDPLTRDTSSAPNKDWINVESLSGQIYPYNISYDYSSWELEDGFWQNGSIRVADIESAKVLDRLHGK